MCRAANYNTAAHTLLEALQLQWISQGLVITPVTGPGTVPQLHLLGYHPRAVLTARSTSPPSCQLLLGRNGCMPG
jgi:hypothetical protein